MLSTALRLGLRPALRAPTHIRGGSSYNRRAYSSLPDAEELPGNLGKKREKTLASVDAPLESGTTVSGAALSASQQGFQGEASLATTSVKTPTTAWALKQHRVKVSPFSARYDPVYGFGTYNTGPYSFTAEGSPGGFGPLSTVTGFPTPYAKFTAAKKLAGGAQVALATGWPFVNYTPPPTASSTEVATTSAATPAAQLPVAPQGVAPLASQETEMSEEVRRIMSLYEASSGYDPSTRD